MTALKYQVGKAIFSTLLDAKIARGLSGKPIENIYIPIDEKTDRTPEYYEKVQTHYFRNLRGKRT